MSGREDSRRRQTTSQGSIFVDTSQIALLRCAGDRGASAADVVVHTTGLDELGGDASSACRQRRKVALLAYKLQMNSQERCLRHQHHQQLCQAILCGRFVSYILYLCKLCVHLFQLELVTRGQLLRLRVCCSFYLKTRCKHQARN